MLSWISLKNRDNLRQKPENNCWTIQVYRYQRESIEIKSIFRFFHGHFQLTEVYPILHPMFTFTFISFTSDKKSKTTKKVIAGIINPHILKLLHTHTHNHYKVAHVFIYWIENYQSINSINRIINRVQDRTSFDKSSIVRKRAINTTYQKFRRINAHSIIIHKFVNLYVKNKFIYLSFIVTNSRLVLRHYLTLRHDIHSSFNLEFVAKLLIDGMSNCIFRIRVHAGSIITTFRLLDN